MHAFLRLRSAPNLTLPLRPAVWPRRARGYTTRPKAKSAQRRAKARERQAALAKVDDGTESEDDPFSPDTRQFFAQLEAELDSTEDLPLDDALSPLSEDQSHPSKQPPSVFPDYRIPHRFVGFDPRRMDLEDFPRLRTDFDGKRSKLIWMGTECQRCGLQVRREKRTNRETSLNIYAHPGIPDDLMRHCPEQKTYPVLWRTRDPYVALDVLGVEDC